MKLKPDENLPESPVAELAASNHEVDNVRQEGLAGRDDLQVWTAAQAEGRFLITQDLDFPDMRRFQAGSHYGILLVRLPQAGAQELTRKIIELFRSEDTESWAHCFVVLSAHQLRILRPPGAHPVNESGN